MYIKEESESEIVYKLNEHFKGGSITLYGKVKEYMLSMDEDKSKKYFSKIKNNKFLNLLILEKKLIDVI